MKTNLTNLKKRPNLFEQKDQKETFKINKPKIIYNGTRLGLSPDDVMRLDPQVYYELLEQHEERMKALYGK